MGRVYSGDDLDAPGGAGRQHRAYPLLEQRIVTAVGIFHARLLRQRHGSLTETLEYQILDVTLFGELDRGLDAIAREPAPDPIRIVRTPCPPAQRHAFLAREIESIQAPQTSDCARAGIRAMRQDRWTVDGGWSNVASRLEQAARWPDPTGGNDGHGSASPGAT